MKNAIAKELPVPPPVELEEQLRHNFRILNPIMFRSRDFFGKSITKKKPYTSRVKKSVLTPVQAPIEDEPAESDTPAVVFNPQEQMEWQQFCRRVKTSYTKAKAAPVPHITVLLREPEDETAMLCNEDIEAYLTAPQIDLTTPPPVVPVEPSLHSTLPVMETDIGQGKEEPIMVKEEPKELPDSPYQSSDSASDQPWGVLVDEPAGLLYSLQSVEPFGLTQARKRVKAITAQPTTLPPLLDVSRRVLRSSGASQPPLQV